MWYLKVLWHHDFPEDPVELFSEIGDDRYEVRKVEIYRDGRLEWADESRCTPAIGLGEVPVPPLEEIAQLDEFTPSLISAYDFEQVWRAARGQQH